MVCCLIRPSNGFARDLINNKIIALYFFIWILTNLVHEKQWVYNAFIHGFIWCTECTQSRPVATWKWQLVCDVSRGVEEEVEVKLGKY